MTDNYIIFLKNITENSYKNIEDTFNERLLENLDFTEKYKSDETTYNKIEHIFKNMTSWKKTSNLKCWSCDFTFNSVPVFIPISIRLIRDEPEEWNIPVLGNFCCFSCV